MQSEQGSGGHEPRRARAEAEEKHGAHRRDPRRPGVHDRRPTELRVREIPVDEADRRARAGGYQGMLADELDCLLCDEVSDPAPLEALLGRKLLPLDEALAVAVRAA